MLVASPSQHPAKPAIDVVQLKLIHTATPDATKPSCPCRIRFGDVNWIPDNSRLSPTENSKSEHAQSNRPIHTGAHQTRYRPDRLVVSGAAVRTESARPPRQVRAASECVGRRRHCRCDRRTHSDAERTSRTVGPIQFTPPDTAHTSCGVWRAV